MSMRVLNRFVRPVAATVQRRTMAQLVPSLGSEDAMQKEAVAQIRARIEYQKSLIAAQHVHDDEDEMFKWLKISLQFAVPATLGFLVFALIVDEHHHRKPEPLPEHMKIRSKEFPWKCSDCDLFDGKCWKACKEGN